MTPTLLLVLVTVVLIAAGATELFVHRRNLGKIPIRVHVNGTRGKSSVTRLIAAGLRQSGKVTCAKTTGTTARMILPDGRELPIFRPAGPNVIEQRRIVSVAAAYGAEVLVVECMALQPELQALSEAKMIRATHAVITNARPDHLDVMGPGEQDVARALAGMIPPNGMLFTAEENQLAIFEAAAKDRRCKLAAISHSDVDAITPEELAPFRYTEHPDNVALALRVCEQLGVDRKLALSGMQQSAPDPGALTSHEISFFGRRIVFLNGFAANDPVSTQKLWDAATTAHPEVERRIALFNCRADRPERSMQLARSFPSWAAADYVVLMGSGTYIFAREANNAGFDASRLVFAEDTSLDEVFERIVGLIDHSALVMGMGNIGGQGLALARYFKNRAAPVKAT